MGIEEVRIAPSALGAAAEATNRFLQNAIIVMTLHLGAGVQPEEIGLGVRMPDRQRPRSRLLAEQDGAALRARVRQSHRPDRGLPAAWPGDDATDRPRELGEVLMSQELTRRNLLVEIDESVIDLVIAQGFGATYGAQPLKRAIEQGVVLPVVHGG